MKQVIIVKKENILSRRFVDSDISGSRRSFGTLVLYEVDVVSKLVEYRQSVILRCLINHNNLRLRPRLIENTPDCLPK
jgi:hypothetical protein